MIEFEISATDDLEFINIIKKIIIGNIIVNSQKKVFIIKVDNWFNHKWLGYAGGYHHAGLHHTPPEDVTLPPFSENRIESKNYYELNENLEDYIKLEPPKDIPPYDIQIPEAGRRIRKNFPGVGFFWYSGNTATNNKGSLMGYVWTDEGCSPWYIGFTKDHSFKPYKMIGIHEREVQHFSSVSQG